MGGKLEFDNLPAVEDVLVSGVHKLGLAGRQDVVDHKRVEAVHTEVSSVDDVLLVDRTEILVV